MRQDFISIQMYISESLAILDKIVLRHYKNSFEPVTVHQNETEKLTITQNILATVDFIIMHIILI